MTDWSQLVQEHGPVVWRTVRRLVNHDADAADCFQRTFVSALELSRAEAIRNWPGLLKRLATARALDCLRQRKRESSRLTPLREASAIDRKALGPVLSAEASELADHLREALGELDDRQAQVFCLACLEDWPYEEIAQQLGVTVNHIGVLLNRVRTILRERLRCHDPSSGPSPSRAGERRGVDSDSGRRSHD
jgi:RNA polymerase sigma-70 factor, ECF subfamily